MRAVLILTSLLTGLALAGACDREKPQMVGEKTEVTAFGERCLGFDLGGATEKPYRVTALSVPYGVGQTLMPVDISGTPVNTFDQPVTLEAGQVKPARVEYQAQEVAYLRVNFEVSVERGSLTRSQGSNSREIAAIRPGQNLTAPWVVGWLATFGLIGIFAWPNASATATYDEVVPLNAAPITYSVGGGGGCLAFNGAWDSITVYPSQLQPGRLYTLKVGLRCEGLFQGNLAFVGQEAPDLIGLRWERDGVWQNSRYPAGGKYGDPNYPFGDLLPYNTPIYWEVPTPGYLAHAAMVDTGVFNTKAVPVRADVQVPYRLRSLTSRIFRDPDTGEGTTLYTGEVAFPLPDHPRLGRVGLIARYTDTEEPSSYTLVQMLAGSSPISGTASFTIGDFSYPVLSVSWQTETTSASGATYTRQVPQYSLGSAPSHDIVLRSKSIAWCTLIQKGQNGLDDYDCGSYGRLVGGVWN